MNHPHVDVQLRKIRKVRSWRFCDIEPEHLAYVDGYDLWIARRDEMLIFRRHTPAYMGTVLLYYDIEFLQYRLLRTKEFTNAPQSVKDFILTYKALSQP
jgi:hypothetical protein